MRFVRAVHEKFNTGYRNFLHMLPYDRSDIDDYYSKVKNDTIYPNKKFSRLQARKLLFYVLSNIILSKTWQGKHEISFKLTFIAWLMKSIYI